MNPYPGQDTPLTEEEMLRAASSTATITKYALMMVLLANYNDYQGGMWSAQELRTTADGAAYRRDAAFRYAVSGPCHSMFGASCYTCGRSAKNAERSGASLTTAHIVYPSMPFTEVVDTDLTRSDVVLLCWPCHQVFDARTGGMYASIDALRVDSVMVLNGLRAALLKGG